MKINLDYIRKAIRPRWGRLTRSQMQYVGEHLNPPGVFTWGPFMVLIDLPKRFWKVDQEPSLEDFNRAMRDLARQLQEAALRNPPRSSGLSN